MDKFWEQNFFSRLKTKDEHVVFVHTVSDPSKIVAFMFVEKVAEDMVYMFSGSILPGIKRGKGNGKERKEKPGKALSRGYYVFFFSSFLFILMNHILSPSFPPFIYYMPFLSLPTYLFSNYGVSGFQNRGLIRRMGWKIREKFPNTNLVWCVRPDNQVSRVRAQHLGESVKIPEVLGERKLKKKYLYYMLPKL